MTSDTMREKIKELEEALKIIEGMCDTANHDAWKNKESIHGCVGG